MPCYNDCPSLPNIGTNFFFLIVSRIRVRQSFTRLRLAQITCIRTVIKFLTLNEPKINTIYLNKNLHLARFFEQSLWLWLVGFACLLFWFRKSASASKPFFSITLESLSCILHVCIPVFSRIPNTCMKLFGSIDFNAVLMRKA